MGNIIFTDVGFLSKTTRRDEGMKATQKQAMAGVKGHSIFAKPL